MSCLFKGNISFMSQFLKKTRKTMENSDTLAPVHYDAKVTTQNPNTILSIIHPWCAWVVYPREGTESRPRCFIPVGLKSFLHALSPKRCYSCNTLPWRGVTSLFAHVALLPFVFLPWKQGHCILLYVESTKHIHSSNTTVYCLFLFRAAKMCCQISLCYYLISFFPLTWSVTNTLLS